MNRSLMMAQASHRDILHSLHVSSLASLKQAGSDFRFALKNLDTIVEQQLHSTYMPSVISGIRCAERALHEKRFTGKNDSGMQILMTLCGEECQQRLRGLYILNAYLLRRLGMLLRACC